MHRLNERIRNVEREVASIASNAALAMERLNAAVLSDGSPGIAVFSANT